MGPTGEDIVTGLHAFIRGTRRLPVLSPIQKLEGRSILWTGSPELESEVGVRSPAILMNIRLTVVTVYM